MTGVQANWGWLIAFYLFLAGVAAGAYLSAFVAWSKRAGDNLTTRTGILLAAPCLGLGILLLFFDLGKPAQFWRAFMRPHSSMISVGTWVLTLFFVVCAAQWLRCLAARGRTLREGSAVWLAGFVLAVMTAFYTGALLWDKRGVPFWNSLLLPLLFLASAFSTGISAVLTGVFVFASVKQDAGQEAKTLRSLYRTDLWVLGSEVLLLLLYLVSMGWSSNPAAVASVQRLLVGALAPAFWVLVVAVGLVAPFYFEWRLYKKLEGPSSGFTAGGVLAGLCVLVGGLTLRYLILAAGMFGMSRPLL